MRRRWIFLGGSTAKGVGVALTVASALMPLERARANDGEQASLPYACAVERGRVVLTPSAERQYRVLGPRASHAFTACAPNQPG